MSIKVYAQKSKIPFSSSYGYITRKVTYSKISWNDLVQMVADDSGVFEGIVEAAMASLAKQLREMVLNGHPVKVRNIGSFRYSMSAKMASTAEECTARNIYRHRFIFFPDKYLREKAKNTEIIKVIRPTNEAEMEDEEGA